jgi:diguanylate cyclase (GGDEF)-like protein
MVEQLLLVLTVLTVATMAWQYWGMNRSLVITPGSEYKVWAMGDGLDKGGSIAQFQENNSYDMQCHIKNQIQFPYCSLYIQLGPNHKSIDLTAYQQLLLTVKQTSSINDSISVYLKDLKAEANTDSLVNQISVNQSSFNPTDTFTEYVLPLNRFYVPSWWVYFSRLPNETPGPNLTNINYLVINTGDNNQERSLDISVSRIEFTGKWIEADELYKTLLITWISIFGLFYLMLFIKLQLQSNEEKLNRKEQEEINQALDSKRKQLESLAIYDSGTGILNRRGVIDRLQDTFQRIPEKQPCSVVLISIDNYKTIESRVKENCIDELVAYVALQFAGYLTQKITMARWGKNELLALVDNSNTEATTSKIQQLLNDPQMMKFRDSLTIQISIGVVITQPQPVEAVIKLIEKAAATAKLSPGKMHINIHQPTANNQ